MNFNRVLTTEQNMRATGIDGAFTIKTPALIPVKGEPNLQMQVLNIAPKSGDMRYFLTAKYPKTQIMLHFTMGHLRGDIATLTKPSESQQPVSVAYVVARDGNIYQLFPSESWAFHVGRNPVGSTNTDLSRGSIGIELSNYGPLKLEGNNLVTAYHGPEYNDVYCTLDDTSEYIKLDTPYRDYYYFAQYTEAQYDGLITLLRFLTAQYNIPRAFLAEDVRHLTTRLAIGFKGIISHVNVRSDKTDIGPAFNWEHVIQNVTAAEYAPFANLPTTRGLGEPEPKVRKVKTERGLFRGIDMSGVAADAVAGADEPDC